MGISLRASAQRWAHEQFYPWDPATSAFLTQAPLTGRLFRADRFTSIYHRPTRRAFLGSLSGFPESGVVQREGQGEVFLLSDTLRQEVLAGTVYDTLRQSHQAMPPSGGLGTYFAATVSGTGDDLGAVTLGAGVPAYLDTELQGVASAEETVDVSVPRVLVTHSRNVSPQPGDFFRLGLRWFSVDVVYIDGGLHMVRALEEAPAYTTMTYHLPSGTAAGYNPTTGTVASATVSRLFSALIGRKEISGLLSEGKVSNKMVVNVFVRHIGFTPKPGDKVEYLGRAYQIDSVSLQRENLQWQLEVSR